MAITKCYVLLTNYHHDKHEKNRTKRVTQMVRAAQFYTGRNIARCKHSMANEISVLRRVPHSKLCCTHSFFFFIFTCAAFGVIISCFIGAFVFIRNSWWGDVVFTSAVISFLMPPPSVPASLPRSEKLLLLAFTLKLPWGQFILIQIVGCSFWCRM